MVEYWKNYMKLMRQGKKYINKNKFCCSFMEDITRRLSYKKGYSTKIPIKYSPMRRLFLLQLCPQYYHRGYQKEHDKSLLEGISIKYCPCCGTKLPKELTTERIKAIKDECKINVLRKPELSIEKNLPHKFWSNKWWKERAL
jgi:hypothetical protein